MPPRTGCVFQSSKPLRKSTASVLHIPRVETLLLILHDCHDLFPPLITYSRLTLVTLIICIHIQLYIWASQACLLWTSLFLLYHV
jgi:hypothetical protein